MGLVGGDESVIQETIVPVLAENGASDVFRFLFRSSFVGPDGEQAAVGQRDAATRQRGERHRQTERRLARVGEAIEIEPGEDLGLEHEEIVVEGQQGAHARAALKTGEALKSCVVDDLTVPGSTAVPTYTPTGPVPVEVADKGLSAFSNPIPNQHPRGRRRVLRPSFAGNSRERAQREPEASAESLPDRDSGRRGRSTAGANSRMNRRQTGATGKNPLQPLSTPGRKSWNWRIR